MSSAQTVSLRYGRHGMSLRVPSTVAVLEGAVIPALDQPAAALREALAHPIGATSLRQQLAEARPERVAITISDFTRPVPNELIVHGLLEVINAAGIGDDGVTIIIGTGMHRASTDHERREMLGADLLRRCQVLDHLADEPEALVPVCRSPLVSINRQFVESDFRIVTGLIEPHFMAGFSGGRKGVCPGLADAATVRRFHCYRIMADLRSTTGVLDGNPCHLESLRVARTVGVNFLVNVAIDRQRRPAAFYCGDMEQAHLVGTRAVADWSAASIEKPFDLIVTNGGGYPLDQTFYQTVKGMVSPLPAMYEQTTILVASECGEGIGSAAYTDTMMRWGTKWQDFLDHIASTDEVTKDQWQYQMHTRTLARIGVERLHLVSDGLANDTLDRLAVTTVGGDGDAAGRSQRFIDDFLEQQPQSRVAVIPEGPYTMIRRTAAVAQ